MNKQELLDKAVDKFKGVWPDSTVFYIYHLPENTGKYTPFWVACLRDDSCGNLCCTKDEFTKRARELGWVNGYKWGVEYPTNGKKPDLSNDIVIGVNNSSGTKADGWTVGDTSWEITKSFRIVDERYKPVSELVKQGQEICDKIEEKLSSVDDTLIWYDYGKQQAIGLPPVGVECEVIGDAGDDNWYKCKIIGYDKLTLSDVAVFVIDNYKKQLKYYSCCTANKFRPLDYNRKADEEKRKFVEVGFETIGEYFNLGDALRRLYDAGCRFK